MSRIILEIDKEELQQLVQDAVKVAMNDLGNSARAYEEANSDELLDIEGALKVLTFLKKSTLYQKTHRKEIPHMKRGKYLVFKKQELLQWVQKTKVLTVEEEIEAYENEKNFRQTSFRNAKK